MKYKFKFKKKKMFFFSLLSLVSAGFFYQYDFSADGIYTYIEEGRCLFIPTQHKEYYCPNLEDGRQYGIFKKNGTSIKVECYTHLLCVDKPKAGRTLTIGSRIIDWSYNQTHTFSNCFSEDKSDKCVTGTNGILRCQIEGCYNFQSQSRFFENYYTNMTTKIYAAKNCQGNTTQIIQSQIACDQCVKHGYGYSYFVCAHVVDGSYSIMILMMMMIIFFIF